MLGLVVRFMPVILEQAATTSDAQRARAGENRRNPIRRLTAFGIPLMRRTFETADNLAVAMEARCYSETRTDPRLATGRRDWVVFAAGRCRAGAGPDLRRARRCDRPPAGGCFLLTKPHASHI